MFESEILGQIIINGIIISLIYILIALGLSLVFSLMLMINMAHGEVYMLGAFTVYYLCEQWHLNYFLGLLGAILVTAVLGLLLERLIFRPLRDKPGAMLASCFASLGTGSALAASALIVFGERDKGVSTVFEGILHFGALSISIEKLAVVITAAVLTIGLFLAMRYMQIGRVLQAIAQDREAAALMGVNINRLNAIGFAIACGLAGAAGALIAPIYFIFPHMGETVLMKAFMIIIIGGLGSLSGAILGGLTIGFVESFGLTLIGYPANIVVFALVIILLVFRPRGFIGRELRMH